MTSVTKVLLLGSYHFMEEQHLDTYDHQVQKEIDELVKNISRFNPSKIAIEAPYQTQKSISSAYKNVTLEDFYDIEKMRKTKIGDLEIDGHQYPIDFNNEAIQIGFRLGKYLAHKDIYAVDYFVNYQDENELQNQLEKEDSSLSNKLTEEKSSFVLLEKNSKSFIEKIKTMNQNNWSSEMNRLFYTATTHIGANTSYIGANKMLMWYERNIKILVNLIEMSKDSDRILCIYGAGHLSILKELISTYTDFVVVDAFEYF